MQIQFGRKIFESWIDGGRWHRIPMRNCEHIYSLIIFYSVWMCVCRVVSIPIFLFFWIEFNLNSLKYILIQSVHFHILAVSSWVFLKATSNKNIWKTKTKRNKKKPLDRSHFKYVRFCTMYISNSLYFFSTIHNNLEIQKYIYALNTSLFEV